MNQLRQLLRLAQPVQLLLAVLTYSLGLGIARYLGTTLKPEPQFAGGAVVILLLAASNLLVEHFRPFNEPFFPAGAEGKALTPAQTEQLRAYLLALGAACLAVAGVLIFLLQRGGFLQLDTVLLLALLVALGLANAVPPVRLVDRGFGEIVRAYLLGSLTPTLAFLLQADTYNRLINLFTFPLFLIALASFLAFDFPAYAEDLKYQRRSLLMALTWQRAVLLHNLLLVAAYGSLAAAPFVGVGFQLVWPGLLTVPVAAYQIVALHNIAEGARPVWAAFTVAAMATFGLTAYLVALTFWLN
jgi:1,4-dihydroxy-2-naphthoate octaprenyltransferase